MTRIVAALALVCALATHAHADGYYYTEQVGATNVKDELATWLPSTLRAQLGIGYRYRDWALGASFARTESPSAILSLSDPDPSMSSLRSYALDARRMVHLSANFWAFARVSAQYTQAHGYLDGFAGPGVGAGIGMMVKGRIRALGILFLPALWMDHGPMVTAALYVDEGYELIRLHDDAGASIAGQILHANLGFAVGTDF